MLLRLLSYVVHIIMCSVLLTGFIIIVRSKFENKRPVIFLISGGLILETIDLVCRWLNINANNHINYAISQLLLFVCITKIYDSYFLKLPEWIKVTSYVLGVLFFGLNLFSTGVIKEYSGYSYILVCCILCGLAIAYFSKVISQNIDHKRAIAFNIITLFFFSVEAIIAITYNFLIANYLEWVGPIWLFRVGLLIVFYITLIRFAWNPGMNKQ